MMPAIIGPRERLHLPHPAIFQVLPVSTLPRRGATRRFRLHNRCADAIDAQTRLLRQPTVSATQVAFSHANNLWVVACDGAASTLNRSAACCFVERKLS